MSLWNHLLCKPIMALIHQKCRNTAVPYIRSNVIRASVPDERVKWGVEWTEYRPVEYTDPAIFGKVWADGDVNDKYKWNAVDGKVDRQSHVCQYWFDEVGRPMNPVGRTGISGRGTLGRWGPNHAADPLVTRTHDGKLQFVAIKRGDTGEWAIPGGMVDAGEQVSQTLKREFSEETLGGVEKEEIEQLWANGRTLYKGYVDDPRNTDNAWMETTVVNFHDHNGLLKNVDLQAGDDAVAVRWVNVDDNAPLYASHDHFIQLLRQAHTVTA